MRNTKTDRSRYSATIGFLDLLFNVLLGFTILLIILLAIIKVETAKPAVEDKNEFVIRLQWNNATNDDVDLWVLTPNGNTVGFKSKEHDGVFLTRDDLGAANDIVKKADGTVTFNPLNEEIINIRKFVPGRYIVAAHFYRSDPERTDPLTIKATLLKVNPFEEYKPVEHQFTTVGEEKTLFIFTIMEDGTIVMEPPVQTPFVVIHHMNYNHSTGDIR